jgi:hypothetical protein
VRRSAAATAASKWVCANALTVGSTCSARAITASITSTGDSSRERKRASASLAGR